MHLVGTHRLMDVWVPRVTTLIFTYSGGGHCSPSSHLPNHPLCVEQSPVKTEAKELLITSALSLSVVSGLLVLISGVVSPSKFNFCCPATLLSLRKAKCFGDGFHGTGHQGATVI